MRDRIWKEVPIQPRPTNGKRPLTVTVVIPVRNGAADLEACLEHVVRSTRRPDEILVVDDGSLDASREITERFGAHLLETEGDRGPAVARNLGARKATGDIIFFVDSDVCLHRDAIGRVAQRFADERSLDALMGAYDDQPAACDFLSQYKNLLHCFVHRTSSRKAHTFWTGIGAIRRSVFTSFNGFDETFERPSVEDIDFGLRMSREGRRIVLDPQVQGKHRKQYTFRSMLRVDVLDRGIPWMELILREGRMPNDLNLRWSQRFSVILVWLLLVRPLPVLAGFEGPGFLGGWLLFSLLDMLAVIALNWRLYWFFYQRRGLFFAVRVVPLNFLFHFYNGLSAVVGVVRHLSRTLRGEPVGEPVAARTGLDNTSLGS